jgi:deazaflavin-dependent oxidoreductase (nitroreductase family)
MDRPPVQDTPPPKNVVRFVNPVLAALLRSPLHRLVSKNLMLLTVTGRKTGRTYALPVGRYESPDGTFVLSAGGNWRHNLRGGAAVRVTLDGREHAAHAVLEEDADRTAEVFKTLLDRAGARALAVRVNVSHAPTPAEIKPALADRGVAYLKLVD